MLLLVVLLWSYLPGHWVATMLVAGVTVRAATLAFVGVIVWMAILPIANTFAITYTLRPLLRLDLLVDLVTIFGDALPFTTTFGRVWRDLYCGWAGFVIF